MEARKEIHVAKTQGSARKKAVVKRTKAKQPKVKVVTEAIGMSDPTDSMLAAIHESMAGLHDSGLIDKETMRGFDESCLPKVKVLQANEIKVLRTQAGVSQAVFAQYLNTTKSTVSQWEQGLKNPNGIAQKLLNVVANKGLRVLV
jgi:putative transcriptional regulator